MASFVVQGDVKSRENGQPLSHPTVQVFQVDNPSPGVYNTALLKQVSEIPGKAGRFHASFTYPSPPRPNIILRVLQEVTGPGVNIVYNENPATDTRWAIADVVNVHLIADGNAITDNTPPIARRPDAFFVFTRVGNIVVDKISQTTGYAYYNDPPPPPPVPPGLWPPYPGDDSDQPFGGTLSIGGWFGGGLLALGAKYYKIEYMPDAHLATDPGTWTEISDPLSNSWYDDVFPTYNHKWVVETMGPLSVGGVGNLYKLPDDPLGKPWAFPDLLMTLDTTKLPNGLLTLRIVGYEEVGGVPKVIGGSPANSPPNWASTYVDPFYGTLKLQLDNTAPTCRIDDIYLDGTLVEPCRRADLAAGLALKVDFEAQDTRNHLRLYRLDAIYGHNQVVFPAPATPPPSVPPSPFVGAHDDYSAHIDGMHHWQGSTSYKTQYDGSTYDDNVMPPCAYNFRLRVDKRTTNGYGLLYWGYEDNYLIIIKNPPP